MMNTWLGQLNPQWSIIKQIQTNINTHKQIKKTMPSLRKTGKTRTETHERYLRHTNETQDIKEHTYSLFSP